MSFRKAVLTVVVVAAVAGAGFVWKRSRSVEVNITSWYPDASIEMAKIEPLRTGDPRWFAVDSGSTRLEKGAYLFRLKSEKRDESGLIAVQEPADIVLK